MTAPPDVRRGDLPTGTVTFLRTDVQGSMVLARALGERWDSLNRRHLDLIGRAVAAHGGITVRTEGDALFAAFPEAIAAVEAAAEAQRPSGMAARSSCPRRQRPSSLTPCL